MRGAIAALLIKHRFLFGMAAQFFYVGAQVGVWSFMIDRCQFAARRPHQLRPSTGMSQATVARILTRIA